MARYLNPFACFSCRRCFRRSAANSVARKCPTCGSIAVALNRKFKAPSQADEEQWRKVELLYKHGFRFQDVYDESGSVVTYPDSLQEAREFVARYSPRQRPRSVWTRESGDAKKRAMYERLLRPAKRKRARHA